MKKTIKLSATILALVVGLLATSCCGSSPENRTITLGDIGWDESIAVANLTKVLLEDEVGCKEVEIKTLDVSLWFEGVGNGDLDAFQDVWLPNHQQFLDERSLKDPQDTLEVLNDPAELSTIINRDFPRSSPRPTLSWRRSLSTRSSSTTSKRPSRKPAILSRKPGRGLRRTATSCSPG